MEKNWLVIQYCYCHGFKAWRCHGWEPRQLADENNWKCRHNQRAWQLTPHYIFWKVLAPPVRTVCWIGTELRDPPVFDGTTSVGDFLEFKAPEEQRVLALDVALKGTSARWWAIHKENLTTWEKFSLPWSTGFLLPEFKIQNVAVGKEVLLEQY